MAVVFMSAGCSASTDSSRDGIVETTCCARENARKHWITEAR